MVNDLKLLVKEKDLKQSELERSQAEVQRKNLQLNGFVIGSALLLLLAGAIFVGLQRTRKEKEISDKLRSESESLLLNILPRMNLQVAMDIRNP